MGPASILWLARSPRAALADGSWVCCWRCPWEACWPSPTRQGRSWPSARSIGCSGARRSAPARSATPRTTAGARTATTATRTTSRAAVPLTVKRVGHVAAAPAANRRPTSAIWRGCAVLPTARAGRAGRTGVGRAGRVAVVGSARPAPPRARVSRQPTGPSAGPPPTAAARCTVAMAPAPIRIAPPVGNMMAARVRVVLMVRTAAAVVQTFASAHHHLDASVPSTISQECAAAAIPSASVVAKTRLSPPASAARARCHRARPPVASWSSRWATGRSVTTPRRGTPTGAWSSSGRCRPPGASVVVAHEGLPRGAPCSSVRALRQ
jgi:hypothetical protein